MHPTFLFFLPLLNKMILMWKFFSVLSILFSVVSLRLADLDIAYIGVGHIFALNLSLGSTWLR